MASRKTADQIKEDILLHLKEAPLSIEQIRIKVESNWSTINSHLQDLTKEGKVKEIMNKKGIKKIHLSISHDSQYSIAQIILTDEGL